MSQITPHSSPASNRTNLITRIFYFFGYVSLFLAIVIAITSNAEIEITTDPKSMIISDAFLVLGLSKSGVTTNANYLLSNHTFSKENLNLPFKVDNIDNPVTKVVTTYYSTEFKAQIINTPALSSDVDSEVIQSFLKKQPFDVRGIIYMLSAKDTITTVNRAIKLANSTLKTNIHGNEEQLKVVIIPTSISHKMNRIINKFTANNWTCFAVNKPIKQDRNSVQQLFKFVTFLKAHPIVNDILIKNHDKISLATFVKALDKLYSLVIPLKKVNSTAAEQWIIQEKNVNEYNKYFNWAVPADQLVEAINNQPVYYLSLWIDFFASLKLTELELVLLDAKQKLEKLNL